MEQIIGEVARRVGIEETVAREVVATFMGFISEQAEQRDVQQLLDSLPGARELVEERAGPRERGGGMMGMLGGMMGGSLGAALSAIGALKAQGLDNGQIRDAGRALFDGVRAQAGPELTRRIVRQLADRVPGLERLL